MRRHWIPGKVFSALAAGSGGAHAIGHLQAAQYSKRLLLLRGVRDAAREEGPVRARRARQAFALLAEIQNEAPDAVEAVLRHPAVGAWAQETLRGSGDTDGLTSLAAAAVVRAGFPRPVEVAVRGGGVVLPSLGRALVPAADAPGTATVRSGPGGGEVTASGVRVRIPADPHRDAPDWEGLRRLEAEYHGMALRVLLDDVDPYRLPGAETAASRPREEELEAWRSMLRRAWRLLVRWHWTTAEEVAAAITVLTPLTPPEQGLRSATSTETFGAIGMSTPPDEHALAVSLAHEAQHAKLGALADVVSLTRPDDGSLYYAPWRDDPRPVTGLLHGVYAHLGVAGYWRRQRVHERGDAALRAHTEFARWRDASVLAAHTLSASGRLTTEGELFVADMTRTLQGWCREPVPASALNQARTTAERHRERWARR
ncbi:hypothetical protein GCM10027176_81320 [Actinoallomurus bryophytorum]|uniref:HEXXH motif-containing protein n=1 Tax=Actinoallomurus bryophytorum TaxID=1490222 RepID=A0A543CI38_9ACTN|nr:HEXXH motif domain-containing protein [Actinoallomurus bryophytorum]TQL96748.1 HEXXH motif-containing protein [Actinoallomurus bryophytorum]